MATPAKMTKGTLTKGAAEGPREYSFSALQVAHIMLHSLMSRGLDEQ